MHILQSRHYLFLQMKLCSHDLVFPFLLSQDWRLEYLCWILVWVFHISDTPVVWQLLCTYWCHGRVSLSRDCNTPVIVLFLASHLLGPFTWHKSGKLPRALSLWLCPCTVDNVFFGLSMPSMCHLDVNKPIASLICYMLYCLWTGTGSSKFRTLATECPIWSSYVRPSHHCIRCLASHVYVDSLVSCEHYRCMAGPILIMFVWFGWNHNSGYLHSVIVEFSLPSHRYV